MAVHDLRRCNDHMVIGLHYRPRSDFYDVFGHGIDQQHPPNHVHQGIEGGGELERPDKCIQPSVSMAVGFRASVVV
jgi:hypothetical protein